MVVGEGRGVRVLINEISAGTISVVYEICIVLMHGCLPSRSTIVFLMQ